MALFKVTTRARKLSNGILIEPGINVNISTISAVNHITANGGLGTITFLCLHKYSHVKIQDYDMDIKTSDMLNL